MIDFPCSVNIFALIIFRESNICSTVVKNKLEHKRVLFDLEDIWEFLSGRYMRVPKVQQSNFLKAGCLYLRNRKNLQA